jgi:aminotransferase
MMDYQKLYSNGVKEVKPSGIRKFFDVVSEMKDAISLGVGEPDFDTPWSGAQNGIRAIEKGMTFYTSNWGMLELRQEVAGYLNRRFGVEYDPKDEILITVGGSEAIDNAFRAYINPGDEVLIPEPSFVCYAPLTTMAGGVPVCLPTTAKDEFKLTPKTLEEAITDKTKILVLPFPNNPTGAVMGRKDLEELGEVIKKTNLIVISDEIYSELTYREPHTCFAEIEGMRERTIVVNGFSKSYAMTGWRLGYAFGPREMIEPICKIHQYAIMSAPTISQMVALECLRSCDDDIARMRNEYNIRRLYVLSALKEAGLSCFEPQGAFYVFPSIAWTGLSSEEFCERLLSEQKVAVVPGNAFGESGEGYVRISYSYSMAHLREAMKRLQIFVEQFKR